MMTEDSSAQFKPPPPAAKTAAGAADPERRALMRKGLKLAFVAPVLTTFFANNAYAGSRAQSCFRRGSPCLAHNQCCNTLQCSDLLGTGTCYRP